MLKKTLSIAALFAPLFALLAPLAPDAAAYREVCVHFPAGVWFTARVRLEYGDAAAFHRAPLINVRQSAWDWEVKEFERVGKLPRARGRSEWSGDKGLGAHVCLPLDEVREGEHFAVLMEANTSFYDWRFYRYCRGWDRGQPLVFPQHWGDTRRLNLKAWGAFFNSECAADTVG